jgi:GPI-anchor transamidase subunit U
MNKNRNYFFIIILSISILIRLWLLNNKFLRNWFQQRLEISTPLTSWNRVLEGIYLKNKFPKYSYDGDLVHEIPLMLNLYEFLINLFSLNYISYLFIGLDVLNAVLIQSITTRCIAYLIELGKMFYFFILFFIL